MNEKKTSPVDGIKNFVESSHIKDTVASVGEKIKDTISDIDIKETIEDVKDSYSHGGMKEALGSVGEKIKDVAGKASEAVKESLRNNPGAATNIADGDKVSSNMVKEDVRSLNNNPRNNDM